MKVKIKKLNKDAIIPQYARDQDAGLDLTITSLEQLDSVMHFCFKVKNSKLNNQEKLQHQIDLVVSRLIKTHNINSESFELMFGTVDDDLLYDRCRLRISFNSHNV